MNDSTFVDLLEVRVAHWLEYMRDGGGTAPDAEALRGTPYGYLFADPGNEPARSVRSYGGLYGSGWITLRADSLRTRAQRNRARFYSNYPITGISHDQAVAYCSWRTQRYQEVEQSWRDTTFTLNFALPTIRESETLLAPKDSTNGICALFNYNCVPCGIQVKPNGRHSHIRPGKELVVADSYRPDTLGLYNLHGNAAEMTASFGVAKGGSYREPAQQCARGWSQPYTKPEPWLGFRCVARVKVR